MGRSAHLEGPEGRYLGFWNGEMLRRDPEEAPKQMQVVVAEVRCASPKLRRFPPPKHHTRGIAPWPEIGERGFRGARRRATWALSLARGSLPAQKQRRTADAKSWQPRNGTFGGEGLTPGGPSSIVWSAPRLRRRCGRRRRRGCPASIGSLGSRGVPIGRLGVEQLEARGRSGRRRARAASRRPGRDKGSPTAPGRRLRGSGAGHGAIVP